MGNDNTRNSGKVNMNKEKIQNFLSTRHMKNKLRLVVCVGYVADAATTETLFNLESRCACRVPHSGVCVVPR